MPISQKVLPLSAKLALLFNGNWGLIAFFVFLFGLVFSLGALSTLDIPAMIYLSGDVEIGKGEILEVYETNMSVNEESIYGYDYVFYSPLGEQYWTSYARGYRYDVGDQVMIEYHPERPDVNRIQGMGNTLGGFVFMVPLLISLVWIGINAFLGMKRIRIIQNGKLTSAELTGKEPTLTRINNRRVYKMIFSFEVNAQEYQAIARTHKPEDLEDGHPKTIIYDQDNPEKSLVLEKLPWFTGKVIKERWT